MTHVIPNRAPSTIWSLHRDFRNYVCTLSNDEIGIHYNGRDLWLSRKDARLLAKRINQCLDETKKP